MAATAANRAGLIVLLAKLGPKLLPIFAKMGEVLINLVKSSAGIKAAGAVGSVGLYTYMFTWQMAVALVVFIGIHEYGHLWAMKKCGIKTRGMFFLPGLGAVALADEKFGGARNEAYIAIMGPIFGVLFFVLPMMVVYWYTANPLYAAVGAIMALINVINLLPINPLDGGRLLKAIAYSKRAGLSLLIVTMVSLVFAALGAYFGLLLLAIMAAVGLYEMAATFGISDRLRNFLNSTLRALLYYALWIFTLWLMQEMHRSDPSQLKGSLYLFVVVLLLAVVARDLFNITRKKGISIFWYPWAVADELVYGVKELFALRRIPVEEMLGYERMSGRGKWWYSFVFLGTVVIHIGLIVYLGSVPGAELAKEMLK